MRKVGWLVLSVGLLVGCGSSNLDAKQDVKPPEVKLGALALPSGVQTYNANISATTITRYPGLPDQVVRSPVGLKAAYLYKNSSISKMRLDVPPSAMQDGKPRIIVYDVASGSISIAYADTLGRDTSVNTADLSAALTPIVRSALEQGAGAVSTKLDVVQFTNRSRLSGALVTEKVLPGQSGVKFVEASKKVSLGTGAQIDTTRIFDTGKGVVTKYYTAANQKGIQQLSSTSIGYVPVAGLTNAVTPYHIHTDIKYTEVSTNKTVDGTQDVDFTNLEVNNLDLTYFNVGGN